MIYLLHSSFMIYVKNHLFQIVLGGLFLKIFLKRDQVFCRNFSNIEIKYALPKVRSRFKNLHYKYVSVLKAVK